MAELITNGDFANGDTGWTLTGGASVVTEKLEIDTVAGTATQASIFSVGATYSVSVGITFNGPWLDGDVDIYNGSGSDQLIGTIDETSGADTYVFSFTATSSDGAIYINVWAPGDTRKTYLDDISVTQTAAAATGGGGPRRRIRKTAIINGKEIQVASYEEAVRLFQHFNKTEEKPEKKRIQYRVITPKPRFAVKPKVSKVKLRVKQ